MVLKGLVQTGPLAITRIGDVRERVAAVFPLHGVSGLARIVAPGVHGTLTVSYEQIPVGRKPPARECPQSIGRRLAATHPQNWRL